MLGAALPRGTGQKKGVFEGDCQALTDLLRCWRGKWGLKRTQRNSFQQSSCESFGVAQDIRLTSGNSDETPRTSDSQMCGLERQTVQNYLKEEMGVEQRGSIGWDLNNKQSTFYAH